MKHRVIKMFPDIINRDAFLNREHPVLNPDSVEYIDYWRKEKKRSIEGWWVMEDINHWRWMNPLCYFYINHWDIMRIDELNNARFYGPPDLTDNEWIITSYYTACDGFSGFTGDDNVSCHYLLKKFWDNQKGLTDKSGSKIGFSEADKRKLEKLQYVKRSDGKYKDFIEPFEYLKLHQREPLGYALYQNSPENGMIFTARGNGKDLEENTLVYKEDGAVPIKDIEIGDFIYGGDGKLTKVISKEVFTDQMQYEIKLNGVKKPIESGLGHIWNIKRFHGKYDLREETVELKEFYTNYKNVLLPYKFDKTDTSKKWCKIDYIKETEVKPSVCIGVDNEDSLFVAGDYIVTHNSFIKSSDCGREFTFGGAKYYDNDMFPQLRTTIGECMVGAGDPSKTLELCYKIEHGLKHFKGEYVNGERLIPAPFSKQAVGTFDVGKTYKHKYKKKVKGNWKDVSDGSVIYIVNYGSDVDAGASKRLSKQYVDEVGLIENVDQMHGVSKFSKQAGGVKFGKTISSGTGGSFDKGMAAKRMFYNPEQYEIYSIEDYWENKGRIGLFLPAYYSLRQYKDENGNTNSEEAIEHLLEERKKLASFVDPLPLIQEKMFMPLVPSEMFYSIQENIFPVDLVVERLNEIEGDSILLNDYSAGLFRWSNSSKNEVRWVESAEARKRAIIDLSLDKYQDKSGVVLIYEHPDAEIEDFLYKVVYDPYKIDGKGESYASILVYKGIPTINSRGMRDTIVAEFLGRPKTVEEAHQVAIQLAIYFKTKVLFEDNIPGFKKWCIQEKYYHLLQEEPYRAMKDGLKDKKRTHKVGVTMSGTLKTHCLQRLRSWLLEPRDVDDERITRTNVHELRSLRLLTEFMSFGEGNFDHISAMLLLMLWIDQDGKVVKVTNIQERVDDFDEFFKRRIRGLHNPHFG